MKPRQPSAAGSVRIIGGRWRGRRLPVPATTGLRPTPDRVRETLFNWLMPVLPGAACLDLFAGTGVLGIEALSRGAASACFVERDPGAAAVLRASLQQLQAEAAEVVAADALAWLAGVPRGFDVVFLDPPYGEEPLANLCTLLERGWLKPGARIYLEASRTAALPALPPGWRLLREKTAGQVRYALAQRE